MLKQIIGSKIILFVLLSFLFSCRSIKDYRKYNYFNGSDFYNDSLNIGGRFFGDIKYYKPYKKLMKEMKTIKNISYNDLLVYGKTNSPPKYKVYLFYKEKINKNKIDHKKEKTILLKNDTINNVVAYKKTYSNKSFVVVLKSSSHHKSNVSILQDAKSIINSMRFDSQTIDKITYMKIFNTYKNNSNILYVMNKFDKAPIKKNKKTEWMKLQLLLTILSKDNEYYRYKEFINNFELKRKEGVSGIINNITTEKSNIDKISYNKDAIDKISELSSKGQIVMLNEMHWKPEHRAFASELLQPLKNNGYTYLAIEAVDKEYDSILNYRKYPLQSTGYYTREPNFGLFIRKAIRLGYKIIGYDDFSTDDREKTQAKNITSIFDNDPNAKVFVYAGIDHILENSKQNSNKRMAEIFKEETGINPLTIDQVELVANTNNRLTLLNSKLLIDEKRVNTNVDFFLINNINNPFNSFLLNNTTSFSIKDKNLIKYNKQEVLVSLYFQNEYIKYKSNCVPLLNRIKRIENNQIDIILPIGKYHITVRDIENFKILSKKIDVK